MNESLLDRSENLYIFSGTSHPCLANGIANYIGEKVCNTVVQKFNNGETQVMLGDNVRGKHVFVLQTFCTPVNEMIVELLVMVDAIKRASASSVTAVIPYYAYNRQDQKFHDRDPITAKLLANMITAAGVDRVITMDLHSGQLEGFFDLPVEHIFSEAILGKYILELLAGHTDEIVVVSPDMAGVSRARYFAKRLNAPMVILDRRRPKPDVAVVVDIVGDVKDKTALLIDDTIDTAGSIVEGAKALKEAGAKSIYAACTHAVLSGNAVAQLANSHVEQLIVTDTIPLPKDKQNEKIKVVTISPIFGEVILRIFNEQPVSKLYD